MNDLVLVPTIPAEKDDRGAIVLTKKFVEGVHEWARRWDGPVRLLMELGTGRTDNLDHVVVGSKELPYALDFVDVRDSSVVPHLQGAAAVVGVGHHRQLGLAKFCRQAGVPLVYTTEYSLRTRIQIVRSSGVNVLRQARRAYWEWWLEGELRKAIRSCAGVQCNGTPTYDAYKALHPQTLLFFDTRIRPHQLIPGEDLERRLTSLDRNEALRLVFSGRLNRMKGADHLVPLARKLRERGVAFHLSICGDGDCVPEIQRDIERWGLERYVTYKGVLDFSSELVPFVKDHCDLFVCCHRQGDPSCTYLETLALGVPIVGYDNEAFLGILDRVDAGRAVVMDGLDGLADLILRTTMHRESLKRWARQAVAFATEHTFDATFTRRADHVKAIAGHRTATAV